MIPSFMKNHISIAQTLMKLTLMHSVENIVHEVTFQFWAIFINFGQFFGNFWTFLPFFAIFGQFLDISTLLCKVTSATIFSTLCNVLGFALVKLFQIM